MHVVWTHDDTAGLSVDASTDEAVRYWADFVRVVSAALGAGE
jgi:hypothetical protein